MRRSLDGPLSEDATPLDVQLYLRDDLPPIVAERIDTIVDRVDTLDQLPHIDSVDISTWEPITDLPSRRESRSQRILHEFERWADAAGMSLSPAFDRRSLDSALCRRTYERTFVPIVAMAVSADERLRFVAPSRNERSTYTVDNCLDIVASHGIEGLEAICNRHSPPPIVEHHV